MRPLIFVSLLMGMLVYPAIAYREAGAAERLLYYSAYVGEEIMGGVKTIAPGCKGTRPSDRCDFNEFLKYLWVEDKDRGDTKVPDSVTVIKPNPKKGETVMSKFLNAKLANLLQSMNSKNSRSDKKFSMAYNIDKGKLIPGETNYDKLIQKCGERVRDLRLHLNGLANEDPNKELGKDLISRAGEAATFIAERRGYEMDHNTVKSRLAAIAQLLGEPESFLETKKGPDTTGRLGSYQSYDAAATIAAHPEREADIRRCTSLYLTQDNAEGENARKHQANHEAAKKVQTLCGC